MYRQRRSGGISTFLVVIVLGVIAGIVYLSYNNTPSAPPESTAATPALDGPTAAPVVESVPTTAALATPLADEKTAGASFYAPTAGITGQIVETYLDGTSWDVSQLGPNVGHLEGTGWLDTPGNIVLAGHVEMADGRPGIFADLDKLQIGDAVIVTQDGQDRVYEVHQKFKTAPDDLSVVYPTPTQRLTLITCSNYDFLQDSYDTRFVVIAERLS